MIESFAAGALVGALITWVLNRLKRHRESSICDRARDRQISLKIQERMLNCQAKKRPEEKFS